MNKIIGKVSEHIAVGDVIAVAVSGGVDSMVLLHAFSECAKKQDFKYFAINVEHGIRGETSRRDSAFVADYCKKQEIKLVCESADVLRLVQETGGTVEERAREVRYAFFGRLLSDNKCNKVALAHHMSDQAETVLMRAIRGTGISGLSGMKAVNGSYIRPLLSVTKEEIFAYAKEYGIPYVEDESNLDNNYTRNLLRNTVMPELKKLSQNAEQGLVRLSRIAAEAEEFFALYDNPVTFDGEKAVMKIIADEPKLLFKRRAKKCFYLLGVSKDIEEIHLELLCGLIDAENGKRLDMPYGVTAYKEYDSVVFARPNSRETDLTIPFSTGEITFMQTKLHIAHYKGEALNKGELLFDVTAIPEKAVFRKRREGDRFTKFGGGTKSLGDYLTDKKIPLRARDNLIVCASDGDVLIIAGIEISNGIRADFSSDKTKENIYKITLEA